MGQAPSCFYGRLSGSSVCLEMADSSDGYIRRPGVNNWRVPYVVTARSSDFPIYLSASELSYLIARTQKSAN